MKRISILFILFVLFILPAGALAQSSRGDIRLYTNEAGSPISITSQNSTDQQSVRLTKRAEADRGHVDVTLTVALLNDAISNVENGESRGFALILWGLAIAALVVAGLLLRKKIRGMHMLLIVACLLGTLPLPAYAQGPNYVNEVFDRELMDGFTFESVLKSSGEIETIKQGGTVTGLKWYVKSHDRNVQTLTYRLSLNESIKRESLDKPIRITSKSELVFDDIDARKAVASFPEVTVALSTSDVPPIFTPPPVQAESHTLPPSPAGATPTPTVDTSTAAPGEYALHVNHYLWDGSTARQIGEPVIYRDIEAGSTYHAIDYILKTYPDYDYLPAEIDGWFTPPAQNSVTVNADAHAYTLDLYYADRATLTIFTELYMTGYDVTQELYQSKNLNYVMNMEDLSSWETAEAPGAAFWKSRVRTQLRGGVTGYYVGQTVDLDVFGAPDEISFHEFDEAMTFATPAGSYSITINHVYQKRGGDSLRTITSADMELSIRYGGGHAVIGEAHTPAWAGFSLPMK